MDTYLAVILLLLLFGFVFTGEVMYFVMRQAYQFGVLSYPGGRKNHNEPVPSLGGVAIFLPVALVFVPFFILIHLKIIHFAEPSKAQMISLFIGSLWILSIGVLDDKFTLNWKQKLIGQIIGVCILIVGGHTIRTATIPFLGPINFGWFGPILFGFCVLVITNAINLIDGLDGLAGGICFFAALTSGIIGYFKGDMFTAVMAFTLSGALMGFLRHNFPPASIYMGDGGSLMLGFVLGTLATSSAAISPGQRAGTMGMLIVPFLPFGIALLDVAMAIVRRWISGRKIFWADSEHIHHRLMERFRHPRRVVTILYVFSALLSALTICLTLGPGNAYTRMFIYLASLAMVILVVLALRLYRNESIIRTLANRPHFKYLCWFNSFMIQRVQRSESKDDLLNLLERGVKDLGFDNVEVWENNRKILGWSNFSRVHPDKVPLSNQKEIKDRKLLIRWTIPNHDSDAYRRFLDITWFRFMRQIERQLDVVEPLENEAGETQEINIRSPFMEVIKKISVILSSF